jgi:uncharacterized membrane protein
MDQLAIQLGIQAGQYDQVLAASASVGQLVTAAANALQQNGQTLSADVKAGLLNIGTAVTGISQPGIKLGDLLNIKTGTPVAGLDTGVQLFQLVQGIAQLANTKNAAYVSQSLSVPGVLKIDTKVKVIEAPQYSAIGNPIDIAISPIKVRTAQVRTYVSVDLIALTTAAELANAVLGLVTPITDLLNNVLHLNLEGLACVVKCTKTDPKIAPNGSKFQIAIDAAGAESHVTGFDCTSDASKTLKTDTTLAAATIKVGVIDETEFFSSTITPTVKPLVLVDIGTQTCGLFGCTRTAFAGGGLGLTFNAPVIGTSAPIPWTYTQPPEIKLPSMYKDFAAQDIVASVSGTLSGITVNQYAPSGNGNLLGNVMSTVASVFNTLIGAVSKIITTVLSPALDPLLNGLLKSLGVELVKVTVGANLSCHPGQAKLVI